jgi:DNA-directed RNA polymerase specialized sigma24 family protein
VPPIGSRTNGARSITADGLARLLASLDPDSNRAGEEYERLRRTLVRFFDWRGAWPPDECADDTLDRLARKLEEGTSVGDVRNYAHGIARLVLLERRRQPRTFPIDETINVPDDVGTRDEYTERRVHCFDHCFGRISSDDRSLAIRYYEGERQAKIANRHRLASTLGLSANALRSRMRRLRDGLEQCIDACASRGTRDSP